jgi:hypothetical protein
MTLTAKRNVCLVCRRERHNKKYATDKEFRGKRRAYQIKKKYGLTLEEMDSMLLKQNGACAICKKDISFNDGILTCIDHCHNTGVVRGILCVKCNTMIGMAEDSIKTLQSATQYLNSFFSKVNKAKVKKLKNVH